MTRNLLLVCTYLWVLRERSSRWRRLRRIVRVLGRHELVFVSRENQRLLVEALRERKREFWCRDGQVGKVRGEVFKMGVSSWIGSKRKRKRMRAIFIQRLGITSSISNRTVSLFSKIKRGSMTWKGINWGSEKFAPAGNYSIAPHFENLGVILESNGEWQSSVPELRAANTCRNLKGRLGKEVSKVFKDLKTNWILTWSQGIVEIDDAGFHWVLDSIQVLKTTRAHQPGLCLDLCTEDLFLKKAHFPPIRNWNFHWFFVDFFHKNSSWTKLELLGSYPFFCLKNVLIIKNLCCNFNLIVEGPCWN